VKRSVLLSGAVSVIIAAPVLADDLTISGKTGAPVATATAANGTPGNIDITSSGSVSINAAGAAVILNSNNNVSNSGTISNAVGTGAIGVNLMAGNSGSFTNVGTIDIPATGSPPTSTGQFGILLNGSGVLTGNIVTQSGSTLTVSGLAANAITIQSELNGNLTLGGSIKASGTSSTGVSIMAPVDGGFINMAAIASASGTTSTTTFNLSPGSAVAIGSSIGGGFLNAGPVNAADKTAAATIGTIGSSATIVIAPAIASDASDLTIGLLSGSNISGYGIVNRGVITSSGEQPGVSTVTFQIGNVSGDTSGKNTNISGGIYNSGSITATATSDTTNSVQMPSAVANASAIVIGVGATVPQMTNAAGGTISATTGGPKGGNAVALAIQAGATLTSLNNGGVLSASANTSDTSIAALSAYAIQDATGTLTSISNSGTISAFATSLDSGAQIALAADLSAGTSPVSFTNSGTVQGNVLFGSGTGSQLNIEGPNAIVSGQVQATGLGRVNIAVSGGGTGGTLQSARVANAGTFIVGPGGTVDFEVGPNPIVISTSGAASFAATSHILLTPASVLPSGSSIRLIHSDTSLSFANLGATIAGANIPFLYTGSLTADAQNLTLTLQRKTAAQLGLTGNAALIYQPALEAALQDNQLGGALSALGNSADVQSSLDQLLPFISSATKDLAETITDSNADTIGARQRMLVLAANAEPGFSAWGQGFYDLLHGSSQSGYSGHGTAGVVGIDFNQAEKGHFGVALTLYQGEMREKDPRTTTTDAQWYLFSPYMGFRMQDFFLNAQFNAGGAALQGTRTVNVGALTRVASSAPVEMLASGGITGGYIMKVGAFQLFPQISVNAMDLVNNAYTENGGGAGVDLAVASRNQSSVRAFVGLGAGAVYQLNDIRLAPQLLAGLGHELVAGSGAIDAAFVSVPDSTFAISGPASDRSEFTAAASLDLLIRNWTAGISYNALGNAKSLSQTASLTFSSRF
jgi:hypothetical protein